MAVKSTIAFVIVLRSSFTLNIVTEVSTYCCSKKFPTAFLTQPDTCQVSKIIHLLLGQYTNSILDRCSKDIGGNAYFFGKFG